MLPSSAVPENVPKSIGRWGRKSPTSAAMSSRRLPPRGGSGLETAGPLVATHGLPGPRPPQAVHELARAIVAVGLCGRKPQHGSIARLYLHAAGKPALAENAVHARQIVAGDVEQEMMFEVVVDVVRRDEQPLEDIGARGAGVAQGIVRVGHDGVLGD